MIVSVGPQDFKEFQDKGDEKLSIHALQRVLRDLSDAKPSAVGVLLPHQDFQLL